MKQNMQVLVSHELTEWFTPPNITKIVRDFLGEIDLDPASTELANVFSVKANSFFTKDSDGLNQAWYGRVFVNPPYSKKNGKSQQDLWSKKFIHEYELGRMKEGVLLTKAAPGYSWWDYLFHTHPRGGNHSALAGGGSRASLLKWVYATRSQPQPTQRIYNQLPSSLDTALSKEGFGWAC